MSFCLYIVYTYLWRSWILNLDTIFSIDFPFCLDWRSLIRSYIVAFFTMTIVIVTEMYRPISIWSNKGLSCIKVLVSRPLCKKRLFVCVFMKVYKYTDPCIHVPWTKGTCIQDDKMSTKMLCPWCYIRYWHKVTCIKSLYYDRCIKVLL